MPRVVHFEISAEEPERASKFYSEVFGWDIKKWDGPQEYWMVTTGADSQTGINGGLMKRGDCQMSFPNSVNTIDVASLEDSISKVTANGGKQTTPVVAIPGVGIFAYCQDTEGNSFGIMQAEAAAQ